jgi:hypothetical protein
MIAACNAPGAVQPNGGVIGEADGNCGYTRIELESDGGADLFVLSHLGLLNTINWGVNWHNWSTEGSGYESGDDTSNVYAWDGYVELEPGSGYVTATFGGTVTLEGGMVCIIDNPTAGNQIT